MSRNSSLEDLLAKQAELQSQIENMRAEQKAEAVATIRAQMEMYGITALELEGRQRRPRADKGVPRKTRADKGVKRGPRAAKKVAAKRGRRAAKTAE